MEKLAQARQKFIDSAVANSKALAEGDRKTANKHARVLKRLFDDIENGDVDVSMLVGLLDYPHLGVRALAAIDLLRLNRNAREAEETLERIVALKQTEMTTEDGLRVLAAEMQLRSWKERGYVDR